MSLTPCSSTPVWFVRSPTRFPSMSAALSVTRTENAGADVAGAVPRVPPRRVSHAGEGHGQCRQRALSCISMHSFSDVSQ